MKVIDQPLCPGAANQEDTEGIDMLESSEWKAVL